MFCPRRDPFEFLFLTDQRRVIFPEAPIGFTCDVLNLKAFASTHGYDGIQIVGDRANRIIDWVVIPKAAQGVKDFESGRMEVERLGIEVLHFDRSITRNRLSNRLWGFLDKVER